MAVRVGVISDIHSNLQALLEVTKRLEEEKVELTLCVGDIVGYGADPNRCCDLIVNSAHKAVIGNHDIAALTKDADGMNPYAAAAALWTADHLEKRSRSFLKSLKVSGEVEIGGIRVGLHHGSLASISEYLYDEYVNEDMLLKTGTDVLVFGHTHVPYVQRFGRGLIVNPGSVGQPRDREPKASCAILETYPLSCRIERVPYDIDGASEAIIKAGLPRILADRLRIGF